MSQKPHPFTLSAEANAQNGGDICSPMSQKPGTQMVHYSIAVFFGCLFIPQNMEIIGVEWLWPIPKYQISPGHCHTNPSADSWNIFVDVAGDVAGGDAQKHILVGPDFKQMRCLKLDLHFKKSSSKYDAMWGPPVISWFISPSIYSYKYHKP